MPENFVNKRVVAIWRNITIGSNLTTGKVIKNSLVLVLTLIAVIPLLTIIGGIPPLVSIPTVLSIYVLYSIQSGQLAAGLIACFFVLLSFNANIPLYPGPAKADFSLYLVDIAAVVLFAVSTHDFEMSRIRNEISRLGLLVVGGFATFVVWSYLSALVGNGPSQAAALVFAIEQTRYLFYLIVAALTVARTNIWIGLYPMAIAVGGNLLYAISEAAVGHTHGLTYLGDANGPTISTLVVGSWSVPTGSYAGGFAGGTRELIALGLIFIPFAIYWSVYCSRRCIFPAASVVGMTGIIVKFGESDAGWMAYLGELFAVGGLFIIVYVVRRLNASNTLTEALRGVSLSVFGIALSLSLFSDRFSGENEQPTAPSFLSGSSGTTDQPPKQSTPGTARVGQSVQEQVTDLLLRVPLLETNSLGIRLAQYTAAVELALKYPLFGIGGYNFVPLSESYLPVKMGIHNTLFSHLAATGFPGVTAYIISIVAILLLVGRRAYTAAGQTRMLWATALVSLLSFHAYSFWVVIYGWRAPNAVFWAFTGILLAGALFGHPNTGDGAVPERDYIS